MDVTQPDPAGLAEGEPGPPPPPGYGGFTPAGFEPTGYTPAVYRPADPGAIYSPHDRAPARRGGIAGVFMALLALLAKFGGLVLAFIGKGGLFLLKFAKLGGTTLSMLVALWIYALIFGPAFGLGVLVLIAVHEFGHMIFARLEGVPTTWPIFLGPFGAVIMTRAPWNNRQQAIIAIGGPIVGIAGSFACYLIGAGLPYGHAHFLFIALAYFGCFLNLFNLVPFSPLDGGRVANALTPRANIAGLVLLGAFFLITGTSPLANPFTVVIIVIGLMSTYHQFRLARAGQLPPRLPVSTRWAIGLAYLATILMALLGMGAAHAQLIAAGYVR